ncbi:MAG: nitrate reductase cytochrome c-type subunit [Burkholderiales bacterium]|jgi:cytochrome c-type protein NapB|nr:nitrate reductase cytochrome c-type subunit [Burkholderiales bacterium]
MKRLALIAASSLVIGLFACATQSIPDTQIGLAKGSAFDTLTPKAYALDGSGAGGTAEAAYLKPPLAPHAVDGYVPITLDKNMCQTCHDKPGAAKKAGDPTATPPSHYTKGADGKQRLAGSRYNCELCHAPAANVPDLVKNTGPKPKR